MDGRNPANQLLTVEVGSFSEILRCFIHPRWLGMGFLPSTVSHPFSPIIKEVDTYPKRKETNVGGSHFPFHNVIDKHLNVAIPKI